MNLARNFQRTFDIDGTPATVSVSPCSWMYPGYGLQIEVRVAGGQRIVNDKSLSFANATDADVARLAAQVKLCACVKCGAPAIVDTDGTAAQYRRNGQCEACYMAPFLANMDREQARADLKAAAADRKMLVKGFKFKTVANVHPRSGDDYQVLLYTIAAPTAAEMAVVLKKRRSEVLDDYATVAL